MLVRTCSVKVVISAQSISPTFNSQKVARVFHITLMHYIAAGQVEYLEVHSDLLL